jgi:hypothetical protein
MKRDRLFRHLFTTRFFTPENSFEQSLGGVFFGGFVHFGAFRYQDLGAGIMIFGCARDQDGSKVGGSEARRARRSENE